MTHTCLGCGEAFARTGRLSAYKGIPAQCCSRSCSGALAAARRRPERTALHYKGQCKACGIGLLGLDKARQVFCGAAHKGDWTKALDMAKQYRYCTVCQKAFFFEIENRHAVGGPPKRCTDCRRWERATVINREAERARSLKRRAILRAARQTADRVYRADVYREHGYRCYLCHGLIERDLPAGHPMRPSVDHVIPLARGGRHTLNNLRPAHVQCNSLKADQFFLEWRTGYRGLAKTTTAPLAICVRPQDGISPKVGDAWTAA